MPLGEEVPLLGVVNEARDSDAQVEGFTPWSGPWTSRDRTASPSPSVGTGVL